MADQSGKKMGDGGQTRTITSLVMGCWGVGLDVLALGRRTFRLLGQSERRAVMAS